MPKMSSDLIASGVSTWIRSEKSSRQISDADNIFGPVDLRKNEINIVVNDEGLFLRSILVGVGNAANAAPKDEEFMKYIQAL